MKRTLVVIALGAVLLVALAIPAGIGWLLERQAAERIQSRLPGAELQWNRGWFRSGFALDAAEVEAAFDFRHLTLSPPGWLALDGRVVLAEPPASIHVEGHVSAGFAGELRAGAPSLTVGEAVVGRYRQPNLRLLAAENRLRALATAEALTLADGLGNRLRLDRIDAEARVEESGDGQVAIVVTASATRPGMPESRLDVRLSGADPNALEQLVQALTQLAGTEPGSTGAGLAALGLASAWQQLAARGASVELDALVLDGDFRLSGRWVPDKRVFSLEGGGSRETLTTWATALTGLAGGQSPARARAEIERTLRDAGARDGITVDDGQVRVTMDALPTRQPAAEPF